MIQEFLTELQRFVPDHARIVSCQFRGDPNSDFSGKWRAKPISRVDQIDHKANVYFCVSAMQRNLRGEIRRRKENFAGGLCLMIDDLGDGLGAKNPLSTILALSPTCLIETSPSNFQAVYFFDRLETNAAKLDALIQAFIRQRFLTHDPGMAGINRVFRPPIGINGKPKYGGWQVRAAEWHPENRYSIDTIARAFELELNVQQRRVTHDAIDNRAISDRLRHFVDVKRQLRQWNMLKKEEPDLSGWQEIVCPWIDEHSDHADSGASIRVPSHENQFYGAFRCHHGHCQDKGWRELTDWIDDDSAEYFDELARVYIDKER
jgi:hypothetical protein